MGVVYSGEDTRLGRPVALKFVPEELGRDTPAVHRLSSEARTASSLNHPNICTIYDIGEHDGRPFVVMELLKGQTLRDRLARVPLRVHDTVDIGIQVADALDAAHQHGVVHRDIKPGNVFLVDRGPVKVLDFGLAKLVADHAASATTEGPTIDRTAEGVTVGTVSYMSPEQVSGEPLDARTDLFSLGVVLYESLTGRQPFTGKTSAVIFSAILTRPVVAPVVINPEVPPRLQEVINNCLEKNRELRYPDAAALRADLKRVKRDLESGHSSVFRIGALPTDAAESHIASRSSEIAPATEATTSPAGIHRPAPGRRWWLAAALLVPVLAAASVVAVWVASRRPLPVAARSDGDDALVRTQLGLAVASLDAKDFRAAIAYAEQVLRVVPNDRTASRVRDEARQSIALLNDALARAGERLAAGDRAGASTALADARAIDPGAPAVSDLAARLAGTQPKGEAPAGRNRPPSADASRSAAAARSPVSLPAAPNVDVPRGSEQANALVSTPPVVVTPPTPAPVAVPVQPAAPAIAVPPVDTTPQRDASPAPPPRPAESDETRIRTLVATYGRAIETKDLALFRTVKPNLSPDEQRRIENGFRAVTSQRVALTILAIDSRGQEASVHVRRRDTIQVAGREQTVDSIQTITVARSASGWIIQDIR
jgi:hypothetical protein